MDYPSADCQAGRSILKTAQNRFRISRCKKSITHTSGESNHFSQNLPSSLFICFATRPTQRAAATVPSRTP